jgi:hypothetical protein
VRKWEQALMLMKEPNADADKVNKMRARSNKLRNEARAYFDRQFARKKR